MVASGAPLTLHPGQIEAVSPTIGDVVAQSGAKVAEGADLSIAITAVGPLDTAGPGELSFTASAGSSKGKGQTLSQDVLEQRIVTGQSSYKLGGNDAAPAFGFTSPTLAADWIFGNQHTIVHDKEDWAQVDGEYTLDMGMLKTLKFGARSAQHKRYTDPTISQGPAGAWSTNVPAATGSYPGNFGSGLGSGFPTNIAFIPADALAAYNAAYTNRDPVARRSPFDGGEYSVKETTTAAYLQGNLEGEGWSGNVGMRLVRTKSSIC